MDINTRDFGLLQVESDAVFRFPEGLYGFEDHKAFAVFEHKFEDISFLYLQSLTDIAPCFLIFEPWDLYPGYHPLMSPEDLRACAAADPEELIFLSIANIPGNSVSELSINIKSPVVLNPKTGTGRQVMLQNPEYQVRYHPFFKEKEASC